MYGLSIFTLYRKVKVMSMFLRVHFGNVNGKYLHTRVVAAKCDDMNPDVAYVMGLLHDIDRRDGIMDMKHIYAGYLFMSSLSYDDSYLNRVGDGD